MIALRVGVDVGGTFTDAVAIDAATRAIVARVKVPTTHADVDGVAAGIVQALQQLLAQPGVEASAITFIAHSTTQATNALLEGDVARVGVIGLLDPPGALARSQIAFAPMPLGSAVLAADFRFVRRCDEGAIRSSIDALLRDGAEAIVATQAFGVDRPASEALAVEYARDRGAPATAGHEVATLYGLRARTRTAVLNASILPRMIATSRMTAGAVARAGIAAPLMIMRSDGGVMDVGEVARKPILTMLSGPAAGIAGALLHENVTDGIFIEVGGTSADCSVIRRGLPQLKTARIGSHRTMLRSLDVRTIAVAGGSLVRVDRRRRGADAVTGVGPRSAHIAGLSYATFEPPGVFAGASLVFLDEDASGGAYLALELADRRRAALTPTCAANLLGYVPESAFAKGDERSARLAFAIAGAHFGCDAQALARAVLERCAKELAATVDELAGDYELDRRSLELVGGGGGAAAIVPFAAQALGVHHRIARDAEVISPVGVALALVRDVVERTISDPTPADIVRVRREAVERVISSGADPGLVEVAIEIDTQRSLVRATAQGATPANQRGPGVRDATAGERAHAAAVALHLDDARISPLASAGSMHAYRVRPVEQTGWRRLLAAPVKWDTLCVVDRRGIVRSIERAAVVEPIAAGEIEVNVARLLERTTSFGDVGRALPAIALAYGERFAQLGRLATVDQVVALATEEVRGLDPQVPILIVAARSEA